MMTGAPPRLGGDVRTWLSGRASPCHGEGRGFESRHPLGGAGRRLASRRSARLFGTLALLPRWEHAGGGMAEWLRQGPAKPCTRVRFPLPPRGRLAQRESTSLTRKGSQVQILYRPPGQGHIVVLTCFTQEPNQEPDGRLLAWQDRKSTRLNSSHVRS